MRLTAEHRVRNEARIRAAMDRLLAGDIPPGGGCDVKTLARESGIDRTAFYGTRPYAHLRSEFETRLTTLRDAGQVPDPRIAQITRLKQEIGVLQQRLDARDATITELTAFKTQALPVSPLNTTRSPASEPPSTAPAASGNSAPARRSPAPAADSDRRRREDQTQTRCDVRHP